MRDAIPPPDDAWSEKQLRQALVDVRFYARRSIKLGASEDDVFDQVVTALTGLKHELGKGAADVGG